MEFETPQKIRSDVQAEIDALDKLPELFGRAFPHNGKRDFRGFTQEDYDTFTAGLFYKVGDSGECRWVGGKNGVEAARLKLEELGYAVTVTPPEEGKFWNVRFTAKCATTEHARA